MHEPVFTLPIRPGWRDTVMKLPYWETTYGQAFKVNKQRILDPIQQILSHPKTEDVLVRLIKESKGKLSSDKFLDVLWTCYLYLFSRGHGIKRQSYSYFDKKELKRMADNAHELHKKVQRLLNVMDPHRTKGKPLCKGSIELWAKGHYRDVEFGGDQLDDEKIFYALDITAKFLDKMAEPNPSNRPQDIHLDLLISDLESNFRKHFEGRPLYPVIAGLVQVTTDVLSKGNNGADGPDASWTTARVITRLKRYHKRRSARLGAEDNS